MYGASDPAAAERTAFRRAEKQYKLYKPPNLKGRSRSRSKPAGVDGDDGDLSAVVDFNALLAADGELPAGIGRRDCAGFDRPVFCFLDRPGFYFIPGALSTEEQCYWIRGSLKTFPQPPNRTNLTAIYGSISDLFTAAKNQKILVEVENSDVQEKEQNKGDGKMESKNFKFVEDSEIQKGEECRTTRAITLMRKLRWSTLGLQFDWSKYYGDMLGGHVDDMEADWTKPIVSISLGCKCIFLLGGKTRDEVPTAMFLRSGDIVLMAGEARERFHGVPRIFTESDQQEISALVSQLSGEDDCFILHYVKNSRININIRQVY
ncbi:alpha-ketoglutarate-dependent dioxygenase alkB [Panicum miliaceum]|uniref:Alpha-ketoglutarate-dependent dioxygenase alkB n=1 Tax=Panicum miliaceum TaxID=4540 RepID=A0A3L6PKQ2_PANMI|nr:alpha-ketoglutarate-dependent dioxygenase alkB [Panicum miliaceum]